MSESLLHFQNVSILLGHHLDTNFISLVTTPCLRQRKYQFIQQFSDCILTALTPNRVAHSF